MKFEAKVVHLSRTPLVGAPGKISAALNRYTRFRSTCFVCGDYPKALAGIFLQDANLVDSSELSTDVLARSLESADVVHIHNDLSTGVLEAVVRHCRSDCRFVYQLHSAYGEGPLYFARHNKFPLQFDAFLTIPHYPQRFEPTFRLVPNLVLAPSSLEPFSRVGPPRVLFSPAHKRTGLRWGDKVSTKLTEVLKALEKLGLADVHEVTGVHPNMLFEFRRTTHVSIDEISTGAFHQVTLEALATGNVAVNGADDFQLVTLQALSGASEEVPFFRVTDQDVAERLRMLVSDSELIVKLQTQGFEFYESYLRPERLIEHFVSVYQELGS